MFGPELLTWPQLREVHPGGPGGPRTSAVASGLGGSSPEGGIGGGWSGACRALGQHRKCNRPGNGVQRTGTVETQSLGDKGPIVSRLAAVGRPEPRRDVAAATTELPPGRRSLMGTEASCRSRFAMFHRGYSWFNRPSRFICSGVNRLAGSTSAFRYGASPWRRCIGFLRWAAGPLPVLIMPNDHFGPPSERPATPRVPESR
jgi:hypothetical protein